MLHYLNNEDSCYEGDEASVQENYGRELLELHTVSVDGGYTEEDVKNSALVLTGWTVDGDKVFRFDAGCHYVGTVSVLDFSHPNDSADGGLAVGEAYLGHLARHPATATYLATKLARRFVADEPPASLVDVLAATSISTTTPRSCPCCVRCSPATSSPDRSARRRGDRWRTSWRRPAHSD